MTWALVVGLGGCLGEQIARCFVDRGRTEQQGWFRELKIADHLLDAAGLHGPGWNVPARYEVPCSICQHMIR